MSFDFKKVQENLNTTLKNEELFKTSFTHRSYLNEHTTYPNPSNERLEFLGDAVLQLLSSNFLYDKYPKSPEGDLTNFRSSIVCTPSLAAEAKRLSYGENLLLSNGEEATGGRDREYILANTLEAFIGSLYLDRGIKVCQKFIEKYLLSELPKIIENGLFRDAKSAFQEESQERAGITPTYQVLEEWGPDHAKSFIIGVFLGKTLIAKGEGSSKQEAEVEAAKNALETKGW